MDLCDFCIELVEWIASPMESNLVHTEYSSQKGWKRRTFEMPVNSRCQLCVEFRDPVNIDEPCLTISVMSVWVFRSKLRSSRNLYDFCQISIHGTGVVLNLALWADKGSPAAEVFATQSPICDSRVEEACDLAQAWLTECESYHSCSPAVNAVELPRRVLLVADSIDTATVKLVESHGMKGTYCALSHCWGPADKQPLRTVRENYQSHIEGIALEQLPKSFQDFVVLARGLNVDYVWIDSLCIIQDDKQDWLSEADSMRAVYRNATVVVAAAGANDSTQGLFITDRPCAHVLSVPYESCGKRGVFKVTILPGRAHEMVPWVCPLKSRGWVLQEWYLARRILFCMPLALSWQCKELSAVEGGYRSDLGNNEKDSWHHLLHSYTKKHLTYPSDRIHALRGIVAYLQRTREDKFLYSYGIWENKFHEQILWRQCEPYKKTDSLSLPSWSWAATGGAKQWFDGWARTGLETLTRRHEISASGSLSCTGHLATSSLTTHVVTTQTVSILSNISNNQYFGEPEFDSMFCIGNPKAPTYMVMEVSKTEKSLGIISFDSESSSSAVYFFVGRTKRTPMAYSRWQCPELEVQGKSGDGIEYTTDNTTSDCGELDSQRENDLGHYSQTDGASEPMIVPNSQPRRVEEARNKRVTEGSDSEVCVPGSGGSENDSPSEVLNISDEAMASAIANMIETTPFVYWCLILEPVGEGKYKRSGLAMLYPDAFNALGAEIAEFEIV